MGNAQEGARDYASEILTRCRQVVADRKLTVEQIMEMTGLSQSSAYRFVDEKNKSVPRAEHLARFCESVGCSGHFILLGVLPMYAAPTNDDPGFRAGVDHAIRQVREQLQALRVSPTPPGVAVVGEVLESAVEVMADRRKADQPPTGRRRASGEG